MEIHEWWGEVLGITLNSSAFYKEFFGRMFSDGKVYATDVKGWPARSMRRWIARLAEGDVHGPGLTMISKRKEGRFGRWYYVVNPSWLSQIHKSYRLLKKFI